MSLADRERGLINTGPIPVERGALAKLTTAQLAQQVGERPGSVLLSFKLEPVSERVVEVKATAMLMAEGREEHSPLRGMPFASNGTLEGEHLEAVARLLR